MKRRVVYRLPRVLRIGLAVSLVAAGCSGDLPDDGSDPANIDASFCGAPELTDKPLRRLSNTELDNTLHALPGSDLAADLVLPVRRHWAPSSASATSRSVTRFFP